MVTLVIVTWFVFVFLIKQEARGKRSHPPLDKPWLLRFFGPGLNIPRLAGPAMQKPWIAPDEKSRRIIVELFKKQQDQNQTLKL